MTEFKPGDRVWLQGRMTVDHGISGFIPSFERLYIPDVPHLDRIARWFSDHPNVEEDLSGLCAKYPDETFVILGLVSAIRGEYGKIGGIK